MYWFPDVIAVIPFSSHIAIALTFVAFIEKAYWLLLISVLICVMLFLATLSIHKRRILFPVLSLIYYMCEFVTVTIMSIEDLMDRFWNTYIIFRTVIAAALVVMLCIYCYDFLKKKKRNISPSKEGV